MRAYQLRLPESRDLERWVDEVSWHVWYELQHHTPFEALGPHAFARIRELLREVLQACVKTYRSCGLWSYCQAGTTPSSWMPPGAFRPNDPRARWYILEVRQGLEELVTEATDRIGGLISGMLGDTLPRGIVEPGIGAALRRGIGRYLYENPNCGVHPLCHGRIPIDPWKPAADQRLDDARRRGADSV